MVELPELRDQQTLALAIELSEQRFTPQLLEEEARKWADGLGWKTKHAFMVLRLALTGRKASPPLFETMAVLGKEIARRRLRRAAEVVGAA